MIKVKSTTDYSKFKFIKGNRPIDKRVKKMVRAIKRKNMLADFPILTKANCDGRNQIFDGQTRFEAAKQLKLPVFYIESPHIEIGDVPEANSVQSPWTTRDYLYSWSERGNANYIKIKAFVAEFGLPITISAALLSGRELSNGQIGVSFRSGRLTVTAENYARRVAAFIVALKFYVPFATGHPLAGAMARLMSVKDFDPSRFLQKIKANPGRLHKCGTTEQYIDLIEDIYNHHVRANQLVALSVEVRKLRK